MDLTQRGLKFDRFFNLTFWNFKPLGDNSRTSFIIWRITRRLRPAPSKKAMTRISIKFVKLKATRSSIHPISFGDYRRFFSVSLNPTGNFALGRADKIRGFPDDVDTGRKQIHVLIHLAAWTPLPYFHIISRVEPQSDLLSGDYRHASP
jgi:hypothetical protein